MKKLPLLILPFVLFSCAPKQEEPAPPMDYCTFSGLGSGTEVSECTTNTAYSPSVSITGTATFYKRRIDVSTTGPSVADLTLGAPVASALPIKYAEIRVLNSGGSVVQCGRTDATGALKALDGTSPLLIPTTAGNYTVQVLSRTNHSVSITPPKPNFTINTAIKKDICSNTVHSISSTVSSGGSGSYNTNLIAYARESESGDVAGGAFNIYNNLVTTYDYLAQNTGTTNLSCLSSRLNIYWTAGFNPAQYIYADSDPADVENISFYLRGYNELYINGGKLGNVSSADTDQFDDAVIIHEIGHYIEDACGKMDSPGGTHNGLFRIDPRLAWSEGWGNFFGAHIIRNNIASINPEVNTTLTGYDGWLYYLDTKGYTDGAVTSGESLIKLDLSRPGNNPEPATNPPTNYYFDKVDSTLYPGEGHFREVSIARGLFKTTNTCATSSCTDTDYFEEMWRAFQKDVTGIGMGKTEYPFRSSIRFYDRLNQVFSNSMPAAIDSILNTDEAQQRHGSSSYVSGTTTTWVPYGIKLVSTGSTPCSLTIQPREETSYITFGKADQRYSSHFYWFDRNTLSSVTDINLTVMKVSGSNSDIDLILYADGYSFPVENCSAYDSNDDCLGYSKNTTSTQFVRSDRSIASLSEQATSYTKRIQTLNNLSFGTPYLLNIKAFTAGKTISSNTAYTYTLTDQSGGYLCPSPTF